MLLTAAAVILSRESCLFDTPIKSSFKLVLNNSTLAERKRLSDDLNSNKVAYRCSEDWNHGLFSVDLHHPRLTLTVSTFLSALENKRLAIVGDSIGYHFYNAIHVFLKPFEIPLSEEDEKRYKGNMRKKKHYPKNVTIYWCKDALANEFYVPNTYVYNACDGHEFISQSDYIILAFGTWYKPKFIKKENAPTDFMLNMMHNEKVVYNLVAKMRESIIQINSKIKFLWRLQPHIGNIDEYKDKVFGFRNRSSSSHNDGLYWTDSSRDSVWVRRFNDVIRYQATHFNDVILDWHGLSYMYMDYFIKKTPVHFDSLHYCLAGVPRGGLLQLLAVLIECF